MDGSTIATIVAVGATVGTGLATLIVPALRVLRRDVAGLRERMAGFGGLFEGLTRRDGPGPLASVPA